VTSVAEILLFVVVGVCIFNYVLLWLMYRKFKVDFEKFAKRIQEIGLENEISDVFSPSSSHQDILKVTNELFGKIKKVYGLEGANSITELITALKQKTDMDENLRGKLIDYFDTVALVSYRDHSINDAEKAEIKTKLKLIIKMLPREVGSLSGLKIEG
jgi:hypothetical protein